MWTWPRKPCARQRSTESGQRWRANESVNGLSATELDCRCGMLLAGGVGRNVGGGGAGFDVAVFDKPAFHFLTAHIGENLPVNFECRLQWLAAPGHHLLVVLGVVNDIAIVKRKIILPQHGTHAIAPSAARFQPRSNFWFAHKILTSAVYIYARRRDRMQVTAVRDLLYLPSTTIASGT